MKKIITLIGLVCVMVAGSSWAMDHSKMGKKANGGMEHGGAQEMKTFKEMVMVDGIHAEFQVMELASMNMTDPKGHTHHVMASFMKDNEKISQAVGKIKLISPSGKEQIATLKDFGSGMFAANFTIDEKGKWGVICLFKDGGGKHTAKFWYPHDAA
ncbi:MAG: hypothetical protein BA862_12620 [Desulfobulbaceae bacterium S3730MH12]|nr:MAG: hypothetical protein BA862_12620 [Desulfobulbaceae bacterium S3730MH12]